jgi:hypothetical protein
MPDIPASEAVMQCMSSQHILRRGNFDKILKDPRPVRESPGHETLSWILPSNVGAPSEGLAYHDGALIAQLVGFSTRCELSLGRKLHDSRRGSR